ncbi:restriction endonuclease subunit S [Pantoea agglomerans]|uniref:restriction endonuclease subunit S n=1 Tax=Enterobacter agglomerans TaxID=549 RepID=UPI0013BF8C5E|nr:restriction endonuclease subunit S [Pantoea agglomerans]NEH19195.1 restriction endonuclease subunit S [Pantoea agglomerans]
MVLPTSWRKTTLGEVLLSVVGGGTPSKSNAEYFKGNIPWMSVKDMRSIIINDTIDHISEDAVNDSSTNIIPAGTPIIATRISLGKIVKANFDSAINQDLKALFPASGVNCDYLVGWYRSISRLVEGLGTGTTVKGIRLEVLNSLEFPLPPLVEQKIIAEKLATLLTQVETIKDRLERIPHMLKRFRESVLSAAVSGKLTEAWRGGEYSQKGYPENWTELGLNDVGELARGKSKHRPRNDPRLFGDNYPFIQTGEVANSNGYISKAGNYYSEFGLSQSKLFPKGTLCITIAANIADTSILGIDACFPDSIVGFTPKLEMCNVLFVKYLIDVNKSNLENFAPATAQKNINLKILNAMKIPFPSLDEQNEIVRRVEELLSFSDAILQKSSSALLRVNKLTQSILAKAFRGELTSDWRIANSKLISGVNSADALLKKIKIECEVFKSQPKPKRTTVKKTKGSGMSKKNLTVVDALKQARKPLSGQQLLSATGYPSDVNTEQLERFFLDIRDALVLKKSIVKLDRDENGQDWFTLSVTTLND